VRINALYRAASGPVPKETNVHQEGSMARVSQLGRCAQLLLVATATVISAQTVAAPPPAAGTPSFQRFDVIDPETGVHSVRLLLTLPVAGKAAHTDGPRFTIECLDNKGKHDMLWSVSFGGVPDPGFIPQFRPTQYNLFPPTYPAAKLRMAFEGYIKSKPFVRSWSELPSGELRYRNPSLGSPNMDNARWFLSFLLSLPGMRIRYAKSGPSGPGEVFFPTQPMMDELKKTPACSK
jgi:hypothetical protein